ncbi:MAG: Na/Pi cotransporter family protein [Firmicutes bacterium]|jgi:phosphate:Na+ symporter|nr:Na/Pi cotransporter family protein [Bacillota bacterium]
MTAANLAATFGYLGLFLFGLHFMSTNLVWAAGPALERFLARMIGKPWQGFLAGAIVTGIIQSSSLSSVMVVGLANARLITLPQAIAVIIGANVGTTMTAQFLTALNLKGLTLPLLGGAVLLYLLPLPRLKPYAGGILGWSLVFLGLNGMADSLSPLLHTPLLSNLLEQAGKAPWRGIGAGLLSAAILQSSSGVMGLVLGAAIEGTITLPAAVAVMIGADLGTCTTALIASLGMNRIARAAAYSHLIFNLVSLLLAALFFPQLLLLAESSAASLPRCLANFHTIYNLLGAVALLPLATALAKLLTKNHKTPGQR